MMNGIDQFGKMAQPLQAANTLKTMLSGPPSPTAQAAPIAPTAQSMAPAIPQSLVVQPSANQGYPGMMAASNGNMGQLDILKRLGLV